MEKTTQLSTTDPNAALQDFREQVNGRNALLVVLGDSGAAQAFATLADKLAGAPGEPRGVIWARNPSLIQPALDQLPGDPTLLDQLGAAQGFALSSEGAVRDVIGGNEEPPDPTRIIQSFARAER